MKKIIKELIYVVFVIIFVYVLAYFMGEDANDIVGWFALGLAASLAASASSKD